VKPNQSIKQYESRRGIMMKKRIVWLVVALLLVAALVLSSCQAATVEEEEGKTVTGKVTETEGAVVEEEEEEAVIDGEEGPVMVRDIKGRLVEKPRYGGTVTVQTSSNPTTWDPFMSLSGGNSFAQGSIYEVLQGGDWSADRSEISYLTKNILVKYTKGFVMESWENPDPLTYVIYLREGMYFQDKPPVSGREVVAADVKYSIDRMLGLGEFAEAGPSPYVGLQGWSMVESVETDGKYTVIIHLSEAAPMFREYWGTEITPRIHPREVVDEYGENFTWEQAVGSGPWMIEDVVIDSMMSFEKYPNYYGWDENFPENRIPYADRFKVMIIQDWSTTLAALRTGKIDVIFSGWEDAEVLLGTNPELMSATLPGACQVCNLNNSLEPYSDIRVRKAMQMAINLPEISETLMGGNGDPYPMMASEQAMSAYFTTLDELPVEAQEGFNYNPERARELLTEAGYPNGFKAVMPLSAQSDIADLVIAYWSEIGIETEIRLMESAAYSSYIYGGNQEMAWFWSCGTWHHLEVLNFWYGGQESVPWNFANANDPIFNDYMDRIRAETDDAVRDQLFKEAFAYGTSQFFYAAVPSVNTYRLWQPWLKGYQGEIRLVVEAEGHTFARTWVDQDMKYEMTGQRN
jgi:peptide/nickel transport system substrate-binding protein